MLGLDIDAIIFGTAPVPARQKLKRFGLPEGLGLNPAEGLDIEALIYKHAPTPAPVVARELADTLGLDLDGLIYGPAPIPLVVPTRASSRPISGRMPAARRAFDLDSLTYGPAPVPSSDCSGQSSPALSKRAQEHISNVQRRMRLPEAKPLPPAPPVEPKVFKHIPFLDGLRALAIFWVLTFHSGGPVGAFIAKRGGWVGVDAFFVISGFLITGILLTEHERTDNISLKNFYIRRALRLMPVYALFIVLNLLINPLHFQGMPTAAAVAAVYLCDLDLALGWGKTFGSGLQIAWSLSVEEKFYLFWPTLMKSVYRHLPIVGLLIIIFCLAWRAYLIVHGANWLRLSAGFDTKIDALIFGCLSAIVLNNSQVRPWLERHLRHGWLSLTLAIASLYYVRGMGHPDGATSLQDKLLYWDMRLPLFGILFSVLIVCMSVQPKSLMTKFFSLPPVMWLGKISYSLYLWHMMAFLLVIEHFKASPAFRFDMEVCDYIGALIFAAVSYYFVEKPFLNLKERFQTRSESLPSVNQALVTDEPMLSRVH